ncbi:Imm7 family immunity protein [Tenacibaculum sp. 190524A02b]|uniref:Imm7 family immunity protein n=1 Tax=Tenacibaculum vairaonense TaxID=3137860 RepID=UPI0031FB7D68
MIEINGWITICVTADGEEDTSELNIVVQKIEKIITPLMILNQIFEIKALNGVYTLFIGLNHNHDNNYSNSVYRLLCEIGDIAIGSYGLVYIRNHEVDFNRFKVLRLSKGNVTFEEDKLLSPCNPVIED